MSHDHRYPSSTYLVFSDGRIRNYRGSEDTALTEAALRPES
jgi:hypothetical protein